MSEKGTAPLELALGVGLLLVPAALLVLSFSPWLEARSFVRAAAAEGARAAILADGDAARAGAVVVTGMAESRGMLLEVVEMCGGEACDLRRGGYVTARVAVQVPLVSTPWGEVGGLTVQAFHAEPVDAYRSLP